MTKTVLTAQGERMEGAKAVATRKPRLGFLGVGWIGRNRLEAMAKSGMAEIAAVVDANREAAEAVAAQYAGAAATDAFADLLTMDLDGVVIATPSALHAGQAIAALEHGKAVFCQKPLGRNAAETASVVTAAREADRLLGVDLSYRHTAGARRIRELIQSGELGEIYAVEAVFHNAYGPDKPWFYERASAGGGCLLDLGIHLVDLGLWCLGFPEVEQAHGVMTSGGRRFDSTSEGVEDYAAGQLQVAPGISMQMSCSWRAPAGCDAMISWRFFGTQGGAVLRNVGGSFYDFVAEQCLPDRSVNTLTWPPDDWGGRAAVAWVEQLAKSPSFDPAAEEITATASVLDRLYGISA